VEAFVRMYGMREPFWGKIRWGAVDPCGFGRRCSDAGGIFGRVGPCRVANLDSSFSTGQG
jgi:hypothetical protein